MLLNTTHYNTLVPVDVSNDTLHIDRFSTRIDNIVSYFSRLPDSEDKERKLKDILRLGILTQESATTAGPAPWPPPVLW